MNSRQDRPFLMCVTKFSTVFGAMSGKSLRCYSFSAYYSMIRNERG
jgi:hypothetical protein